MNGETIVTFLGRGAYYKVSTGEFISDLRKAREKLRKGNAPGAVGITEEMQKWSLKHISVETTGYYQRTT